MEIIGLKQKHRAWGFEKKKKKKVKDFLGAISDLFESGSPSSVTKSCCGNFSTLVGMISFPNRMCKASRKNYANSILLFKYSWLFLHFLA